MLVHVQPQVLLCRAGQSPACAGAGVVPPQGQDFALLFELHEVLQLLEVSLDGSTNIVGASRFSQSFVSCQVTEGVLCPVTQVIDTDVKR